MTRSPYLALVAFASVVALATATNACSGAEDSMGGSPRTSTTSTPTEPTTTTDGGDTGGGTAPAADAGVTDAAHAADAAKPKNAFEGAPAYAAQTGPSARQGGHAFAANTPKTNPAGRPCLNCHDGNGGAPEFAAAGTVFDGAKGAASVEVRVVGDDGVARSAFTDADGNFFFRASTQGLVFPALAGARDDGATKLMSSRATKGNCNECHSIAGGAGRLVVTP